MLFADRKDKIFSVSSRPRRFHGILKILRLWPVPMSKCMGIPVLQLAGATGKRRLSISGLKACRQAANWFSCRLEPATTKKQCGYNELLKLVAISSQSAAPRKPESEES
eukprot:g30765.t1